jgi:hypothetical protein
MGFCGTQMISAERAAVRLNGTAAEEGSAAGAEDRSGDVLLPDPPAAKTLGAFRVRFGYYAPLPE